MPDRYGNPDDDRDDPTAAKARAAELAQAARDAELEQRHADLELAAQARAACRLCDADGYRNGAVCDHVDRTETTRRGIAACRAALTKGRHQ
ncbi:hypothetical protein PP713_08565 [Mycobacterium sp. CSUR Q5927]|nr:hypothetical protein [Mycobacterium sp. CSUR Q5927]